MDSPEELFPLGFSTRAIHAGEAPDPATGAHGVPIYQNATYAFRSVSQIDAMMSGQLPHFTYARDGNPTVRCLELKLADLDGAEAAIATGSGMAAISATLLHLLGGGGHLVAANELYPVATGFLSDDLPCLGMSVTAVDCTDLAAVENAIETRTRAIYVESFSNPMLQVADIPALAEIARRRGITLVVDNTFLSPALSRPIDHGADLVIHSATKYLAGHGNALGGVVCGQATSIAAIARSVSRLGGAMTPFNAWLILAGIKTLPLRMERHCANAAALAAFLEGHSEIAEVRYPGLPDHPGHEVARELTAGRFGGMIAFRPRGGRAAHPALLDALRVCTLAVSLGDVSTLVWPFSGSDLIRLSVGLEDVADLQADLARGLARTTLARAADPAEAGGRE